MKNIVWLFLFSIVGIVSCIQPPEYPLEPVIAFVNYTNDVLEQGTDSTVLTISFTDGDGDLGLSDDANEINLYLTDTRSGSGFTDTYKIPFIPQQGVGNGISGEITLLIQPTCCITPAGTPCFPTPQYPTNELIYTVQIEDRAGNRSNLLSLPVLDIKCD